MLAISRLFQNADPCSSDRLRFHEDQRQAKKSTPEFPGARNTWERMIIKTCQRVERQQPELADYVWPWRDRADLKTRFLKYRHGASWRRTWAACYQF